MKKISVLLLALLMVFAFASCKNDTPTPKPEPEVIPDDPIVSYEHNVKVTTVDELIEVLNSLQPNTKISLAEGIYDFEGKSCDVEALNQKGWMIPIVVENVALVGEGNVKILSTDDIPNGAWATQDIVFISADNVVIDGIEFGIRGSMNKSVEIKGADNVIIRNCSFLDESSNLYINGGITNITVRDNIFGNGALVTFTDGVSKDIKIFKNTLKEGSTFNVVGYRKTGWNDGNVDFTEASFIGNTCEAGAKIELKADPSVFENSFPGFDPVKLFGVKLSSDEVFSYEEGPYGPYEFRVVKYSK